VAQWEMQALHTIAAAGAIRVDTTAWSAITRDWLNELRILEEQLQDWAAGIFPTAVGLFSEDAPYAPTVNWRSPSQVRHVFAGLGMELPDTAMRHSQLSGTLLPTGYGSIARRQN
jgi:hypothetical protein